MLSQNLHCLKTEGTSFATSAERFAAIAKTVADERVDVVLAQEVCTSAPENARAMLEEACAKATGTPWTSAAAFAHRAWVGTPDEADESVAIFARGALASVRETAHRAQGSLRRVMISATVSTDATKLRVFSIHFDNATATARADQGREAASLALVETDDEKLGIGSGGVAMRCSSAATSTRDGRRRRRRP